MIKRIYVLIPLFFLVLFLSAGACDYISGDYTDDSSSDTDCIETGSQENGTVIKTYGRCYVKEFEGGKRLLHLEGSPYEMGYAMGSLLPDDVRRITSMDYFRGVIDLLTGEMLSDLYNTWLEDFAKWVVELLTDIQLVYVPGEYIAEMKGVVAGVNDATPDAAKLRFNDVLLLNLANDVLFTFMLRIEALGLFHACNGFVVTGDATVDGRTLMGRHFMYPSVVFYETALLIEYVPDEGYPFVSVTAPGFVGVTSAMNSMGVSIGMDVLKSWDTCYATTGMGTLLLARKAIQYSDSLDTVVATIEKAPRGVPWMYVVADSTGAGAVIESTTNRFAVRYLGSVYEDQIEDKDDVVAVTNHAIVPEIQEREITEATAGMDDSVRRYTEMTGLILRNYGSIDAATGREIIDFLHPGGEYSWLYGTDPDIPVSCTVTLYDVTSKELYSLFGNYSDTWVHYALPY